MSRKAVFLDRDGVINQASVVEGVPRAPACLADLHILPGVDAALAALHSSGYVLVVVTNQPDVARGTLRRERVEQIHDSLREQLCIDDIRACFHDTEQGCECRKPRPGLLLQAARQLDLDLRSSFMVGDRWKDIEAGRRAGCRTFYVDRGYAERPPDGYDYRVTSLPEAAAIVLAMREPG